jgi:lipid II:glycine glycyltransferase (peptidoglycan interpeptide bridge formation enzyme)
MMRSLSPNRRRAQKLVPEPAFGYRAEFGRVDKEAWQDIIAPFRDASLYQTWSFDAIRFGPENLDHFLLKKDGKIVSAAQVIIKKIEIIKTGISYLRWGPLWRLENEPDQIDVFRQAIRALNNEYARRRGLILRISPCLFLGADDDKIRILGEEGFVRTEINGELDRTLILDVAASVPDLRKNFNQKWRNCLNAAEKALHEVVEGEDDRLFGIFVGLHQEMLDRKKYAKSSEIDIYRLIQKDLPAIQKMRIFLCKEGTDFGAGAICSALGESGIYLFGATNKLGMSNKGSYLIQWKIIQWLKDRGIKYYNLQSINPEKNPGTFRFKSGIAGKNGRDVRYPGQFTCTGSVRGRVLSALIGRLASIDRVKSAVLNILQRRISKNARVQSE